MKVIKQQKNARIVMIKFSNEELLIIRSALLNFKKAPFVSDGEREVIGYIIKKLYDNLFDKQFIALTINMA